jgi:hypothetical protein
MSIDALAGMGCAALLLDAVRYVEAARTSKAFAQ